MVEYGPIRSWALKARNVFRKLGGYGFIVSLLLLLPALMIAKLGFGMPAACIASAAAVIFVLSVVLLAVWLLILAIFFLRYSLRGLLVVVVGGAGCMTMIVASDGIFWRVLGGDGLLCILAVIFIEIVASDPP